MLMRPGWTCGKPTSCGLQQCLRKGHYKECKKHPTAFFSKDCIMCENEERRRQLDERKEREAEREERERLEREKAFEESFGQRRESQCGRSSRESSDAFVIWTS